MNSLTLEMVEEAKELIKSLAPKKAPNHVNMIGTLTGLKIYKGERLPCDGIMVSSEIFYRIFECTEGK